jgi:hypothetical protein
MHFIFQFQYLDPNRAVSLVSKLQAGQPRKSFFILGQVLLCSKVSRPALGPSQSHVRCIAGALFLVIKPRGRKPGHSPPSDAEIKNEWTYTSSLRGTFMV